MRVRGHEFQTLGALLSAPVPDLGLELVAQRREHLNGGIVVSETKRATDVLTVDEDLDQPGGARSPGAWLGSGPRGRRRGFNNGSEGM